MLLPWDQLSVVFLVNSQCFFSKSCSCLQSVRLHQVMRNDKTWLIKCCKIQRNNFIRSTKELFTFNKLSTYSPIKLFSFDELRIS